MAMQVGKTHEVEELGVRTPDPLRVEELGPGEVGYVITGVKNLREIRSGETLTYATHPADEPLAGYREPKPMVFCGLYPMDGDELPLLRESLEKLQLSDASFTFEPESSKALGYDIFPASFYCLSRYHSCTDGSLDWNIKKLPGDEFA